MNEFLFKLLPYKSLFYWDGGNTLTAWWVVVTFFLFLFYFCRLIYVTSRLIYVTKKLLSLKKNCGTLSDEMILKNKMLAEAGQSYFDTFIECLGNKKTDEYSYSYFNDIGTLFFFVGNRFLSSSKNQLLFYLLSRKTF